MVEHAKGSSKAYFNSKIYEKSYKMTYKMNMWKKLKGQK